MPVEPESPPFGRTVLFVCTGNTCRSPLAEGLCKQLLASKLGIPESQLPARGYTIRSAGVAAFPGDEASSGAVTVAAELGVDLTSHRSRPVNPELLSTATDVIVMTSGHAAALAMRFGDLGPEPVRLGDTVDVPDPVGGSDDEYRACADAIARHLEPLVTEWLRT